MDERRQFTRILFSSDARLTLSDQNSVNVRIIDLSLNGALIKAPILNASIGDRAKLHIMLNTQDFINVEVVVSHANNGTAGLRCESFDIDSAMHLRKLIELHLDHQHPRKQTLGTCKINRIYLR